MMGKVLIYTQGGISLISLCLYCNGDVDSEGIGNIFWDSTHCKYDCQLHYQFSP